MVSSSTHHIHQATAAALLLHLSASRASGDLTQYGSHSNDFQVTLWMLPIIYIILCLVRFILTMAFRPLFIAIKGDMSFKECIFVCVAGLRGSASLIMGSAVVTHELHGAVEESFSVSSLCCWLVSVLCLMFVFVCVAGLRGSASLIMRRAVVTHELPGAVEESFLMSVWYCRLPRPYAGMAFRPLWWCTKQLASCLHC